ncbi:hypothetical protein FB451DRAFT_1375554 [Mycena latifolia]|nr:hypothetical protein FB451DRAFT_1375554 [Mycena latifolia]
MPAWFHAFLLPVSLLRPLLLAMAFRRQCNRRISIPYGAHPPSYFTDSTCLLSLQLNIKIHCVYDFLIKKLRSSHIPSPPNKDCYTSNHESNRAPRHKQDYSRCWPARICPPQFGFRSGAPRLVLFKRSNSDLKYGGLL